MTTSLPFATSNPADFRQKLAEMMVTKGVDTSPVQSWTQGAARLANALVGGMAINDLRNDQTAAGDYQSKLALALMNGGGIGGAGISSGPSAAPTVTTPGPVVPNDSNAMPGQVGMDLRLADRSQDFIQDNPGTTMSSGVRSTADQARLYADRANNPNPVARPGTSKHERGLAIDIGGMTPDQRAMLPQYGLAQPVANDPPHVELAPTPAPYQVAGPAVAAPAVMRGDAPQATPIPNATPGAVAATPAQAGALSPDARRMIVEGLQSKNPQIRAAAQGLVAPMITRALSPPTYDFKVVGDKLVKTDNRGGYNVLPDVSATKPTFGVIGQDQFGQPVHGWIDPGSRTTTPAQAQPQAGASTIPPPPAGVDPRVWNKEQSERATNNALPADGKTTSALRNEIQGLPSYKNLAQSAPVYKSMVEAAGRDNRASDVNLIYGMAKIMDPGSVVRESEMTVAQAVATLPQRLRAEVMSQMEGSGRLSPEVRTAIIQEAKGRLGAYQSMFDQDMGMYRGIAQRGRMDERDVIPTFGPFADYVPPSAPAPAATTPAPIAPAASGWNNVAPGVRIREKK